MTTIYPAEGHVSIWVGTFTEDDDFDEAAEHEVEARLKLPVPLASVAEVAFEEDSISTRTLLEGFSGWETFVEEASRVAEVKNVSTANSALVCYHVKCDNAPASFGALTFLGTFSVAGLK